MVLEVVGLRRYGTAERVSFVARGEVVGIAGLMGAGRTELASTIFGLLPQAEGEVRVNGAPVHVANPADAMRSGIMMLPEDRKRSGIFPGHSVLENMTLASLRRFCRGPWIDRRAERDASRTTMRSLEVKARPARRSDRNSERRQSAEGTDRPRPASRTGDPNPRRANPRDRHRRQG